jgi:hypothetical protein
MIKVILILMLFGVPPMVGENGKETFKTMAACEAALPRLDKEAAKAFAEKDTDLKRGKNFAFDLKCVDASKLVAPEPKPKGDGKI